MTKIYGILLSFAVFILALDQWTKHIALQNLRFEGDTIPFLSWWSWTLVHNHGAAFGLFRNLPDAFRTVFFMVMPFAVLGILWWTYVRHFKAQERLGPLAMGLVLGGALGNFVDRIRFGYVVDFVDWFYPTTGSCLPLFYHLTGDACHWPVFNVADSAIMVAMGLLIIHSFKHPQSKT
jgi:signal peptidase II